MDMLDRNPVSDFIFVKHQLNLSSCSYSTLIIEFIDKYSTFHLVLIVLKPSISQYYYRYYPTIVISAEDQ
jgi:hypothetical protein